MIRGRKAGSAVLVGMLLLLYLFSCKAWASSYPYRFRDSRGVEITVQARPHRVVSLVPSITEVIFRLGAGDAVKGITYHSTYPPQTNLKSIVGGFFSPCLKAIEKLKPDLIFVSSFHGAVISRFSGRDCLIINLETRSLSDSYRNILILGKIFERRRQARELVKRIKGDLELVRKKVSGIPVSQRRRVIRLMGRKAVMTPGDDSFQNEMIRAAGGIPPELGEKGQVVVVTKDQWAKFNPQVIYGCGGDRAVAKAFLNRPGWRDVDAVKEGRIFFFPCDLTCRAATNTGYFVQWLSARIYGDYFAEKRNQVVDEKVFKTRPVKLPLDYVKDARIAYSYIRDFVNKSLIIELARPMEVVSTLEGQRKGITTVGNHYSPPPCWGISHKEGLKRLRARVFEVLKKDEKTCSFLFTGADMDHLAVTHQQYRDMEVYALVTAGVRSNAVRMSRDTGRFYEPGTINIIIMLNMKLTPRAMTRAIISATEAKTAALVDLDIRSSENPWKYQATGTGTDNMIVVQGTGVTIDNTGGHSKMGELIARAVYRGVQRAVFRQNGIIGRRNVFQRLRERKINVFELVSTARWGGVVRPSDMVGPMEELLLEPEYSSFIGAALAISDSFERGLIEDLSGFRAWCELIARHIGGKFFQNMRKMVNMDGLPPVIEMALNALLNGLYASHAPAPGRP